MNTIELIKERYQQLQSNNGTSVLTPIEQEAFNYINTLGVPTVKHEEWKYTRISGVLIKTTLSIRKIFRLVSPRPISTPFVYLDMPEANEIVFVNGLYAPQLSTILSSSLSILSLDDATRGEYKELVLQHLGQSSKYINDGLDALNTAFAAVGIFLHVKRGRIVEHLYTSIISTMPGQANILAQPRSLIYIGQHAQAIITETYATIGSQESFTNEVTEIIVEQDAVVEYYKIQTMHHTPRR
jgi:Fe-S cluster assembly protein SufD